MDLVKGVLTSVRQFYNDINPATLTGAIDVIVVEKPNGDLASTPFHVRFGKINVMNFVGKTVEIYINEKPTDLRMKLGPSGEAFFVEFSDEEPPAKLSTSPLPDENRRLAQEGAPPNAASTSPNRSSHSPRKRSDSSPAVVVKHRDGSTESRTSGAGLTPQSSSFLGSEGVSASSMLMDGKSLQSQCDKERNEAPDIKEGNSINRTAGSDGCFNCGNRGLVTSDGSAKSEDEKSPAVVGPTGSAKEPMGIAGVERTPQKVKKRRRKMSKQVIAEKPTPLPESSSSDVEETQFVMDGVVSNDECASESNPGTFASLLIAAATAPTKPAATADGESSPVLSSQEMKTAKTTQPNVSTSINPSYGTSRDKANAREPDESNTSNTTVTSDDEFNWASVASGVAPARLTPVGVSNLGAATSLAVSDGDLSDNERPRDRPPSPARSDTLVELRHVKNEMSGIEWSWGELPEGEIPPEIRALSPQLRSSRLAETNNNSGSKTCSTNNADKKGEKIDLSSGISSTSPNKDGTSTPTTIRQKHADGLYLDDVLAQTDPVMRERYIGSHPRRDPPRMGAHGTGHWDGESGNGPSLSQSPQSGIDSDCEPDSRHPVFDYSLKRYSDLAMSLCGFEKIDEEGVNDRFLARVVTYDEFCLNPDILLEPNLVFRMNGKFYNWKSIAPQMLSLAMFQKPLPADTMERLRAEHLAKKKAISTPQVKSRGWWWSRGGPPEGVPEGTDKADSFGVKGGPAKEAKEADKKKPAKKKEKDPDEKTLSDEELLASQLLEEELKKSHNRKSLRLSSEKLKSLRLNPGTNFAEFKVITAYQGTSVCSCHIYLWKSTDKIVISDIDGTITKSDVLGHILPIIGKDWAQSGVASLFNKIDRNGYKLIYLSARAIGQAQWTRGFLRSLKQDNLLLPDGPVLLNPTSLLSALHREVVAKNPHIFKINCLRDVKKLFNAPDGTPGQPFYAGFGNKMTDALSYKTVSVPINRIFTINHRGEISQELMGNVGKTYHCLGDIADLIFPPLEPSKEPGKEQFSSFTYWKEPLPVVEIEDLSKNSPAQNESSNVKPQTDVVPTKDPKDGKASPKKGA
ncbi:phosphatidate phosphatase LPIN1-like [Tropilaelaps mercedesae]|uniref:phosphatidate phosphatase n=1 Tax=Tropilaelaps mercedesae TaxID=418985 RepID=A0A1V9XL24_9ACAR|nr:phosphatidate phosphatase LPIN1-like [Tropilaelaps mercedesae]